MTTIKTNSLLCIGVGAFGLSIMCIIEMVVTLLDKEYGLCMIWSITGIGFGALTYLVGDYMEYRRATAFHIQYSIDKLRNHTEVVGENDLDNLKDYPGNDDMESP